MTVEIDAQPLQFIHELDQLLDGPSEAVNRPDHHDVKLAASGPTDQIIERGALVPAQRMFPTTNLGVRSSNPFRCANPINGLRDF